MKLLSTILIASFPVVFLVSCEKKGTSPEESFPAANQLVLFQVEYTNHAWGYSHCGIIIDSSGSAGYFNLPEIWHSPDSTGYISESGMNENIQQLDTTFYLPDRNTLLKYFNMVGNAAEGELSDPFHTAYDAGEVIYSGFLYEPGSRRYKQIFLRQEGDWSRVNNATEAKQIYAWLRSIYYDVLSRATRH
jgi:hypothetical protein